MNWRYLKIKTIFLMIFFSLIGMLSYSYAGLEGNEIPVSVKEYDQQNPNIVYVSDKNLWFVVWEDYRNQNSTGSDVYGTFVKEDGTVCGEIQITNSNGNETYPSVAYNQNGQIVVAWQDTRGNSTEGYVYFKNIDISGLDTTTCSGYVLGAEQAVGFRSINGDLLEARQKPRIKYDPVNNQYFIVYVEVRNKPSFFIDCYGNIQEIGDLTFAGYTILDSNLNIVENDIVRNSGVKSRLIQKDVSYLGTIREVYVYETFESVDNVIISIDTTTNQQFIVFEAQRNTIEFSCECNDSNNNNVCDSNEYTYQSTPIINNTPEEKHIFGLWFSEIGQMVNSLFIDESLDTYLRSLSLPSSPSFFPNVAFDKITKRFLVVWENSGELGSTKVYGQLVSSGAGLYGQHILISYQDIDGDGKIDPNIANSNQSKPHVEYDPVNQRFFVIWQDGRNGTVSLENLDIYGQYVDSEGSLRGNNYIINTDPFNQRDPVVAFNNNVQQYLAVWKDARNSNEYTCGVAGDKPCGSDIYGQRFTIGQPQITLFKDNGELLSPAQIDFGITQTFVEKLIYIKNTGDALLEIDCIKELNGNLIPTIFRIELLPEEMLECDGNNFSLLPGTSIPIKIVFSPESSVRYSTMIVIENNASEVSIYLQGLGSIETETTNNEVTYTDTTNPPPSIGGGGGCSISKSSSDYFLIFSIITLLTGLRVFRMKKILSTFLIFSLSLILTSCGTGPGSDNGGSVFVNVLSVDPNYISADVIDAYDDNNDNVCDRYVIPADDIVVNITFKSEAISDNVKASDVSFYKYVVEYYPVRTNFPGLEAKSYLTTCTVKPNEETTCTFTVASHNLKQFIVENGLYGADYNVKITAYGNEVLYDNEIKVEIAAGYIVFDQFLGANDAACTPSRP
ncbi:hypothetical protein [Persephonella sp.]